MQWTRMFFAAAAATLLIAPKASAETYVVTGTGDDGGTCVGTTCPTIRQALASAAANPGRDVITVPAGDYQLQAGQLTADSPVDIVGAGARNTIVRGNQQAFRVVLVPTGVDVSITGMTLRDGHADDVGNPTFYPGGIVRNNGTLRLDRVRITGGIATSGGGIANIAGTLTVDRSLIDGNNGGSDSGGLLNFNGGTMTVRNSTIFNNTASQGGGYLSWRDGQTPNSGTFEHVTIAGNHANATGGVGFTSGDTVSFRASIVADNAGNNCASPPVSFGANVESGTDCSFERGDTSAGLAGELTNAGGDTDVLPITITSPARDLVDGACPATDQRGVTRPQGARCDAGAFERVPLTALIASGPSGATNAQTATFSVTASDPGAELECTHQTGSGDPVPVACNQPLTGLAEGRHTFSAVAVTPDERSEPAVREWTVDVTPPAAADVTPAIQGGTATFNFSAAEGTFSCRLVGPARDEAFAPCSSPTSYNGLPAGDYVFELRTTDAAGNSTDSAPRRFTVAAVVAQTPTPTPTPTATPTPQAGKQVVVKPVSGKILVKRPGSTEYVELDETTGVPVGSSVDTRAGKITLTFQPSAGGAVQRATFYGGIFALNQKGKVLDLKLTEQLAPCSKKARASAAKKPKARKLWGNGKGNFRTSGKYSAATVRGTSWLVQDTCEGTLTRVKTGVVAVRDKVRGKTVVLRAGKRYLAKPRR